MRNILLTFIALLATINIAATEHNYEWSTVFPNYKSQIPSSDFTTPDGMFRFTTDKASGESGPQFGEDSKAGLLLRLYADNTLRIESLKNAEITAVTFVIGGNGHYKLAQLTPSNGTMDTPYLGKDPTDSFREYKLFWSGNTQDVTFIVGHKCEYGIDCAEQNKDGAGTCMTKKMIITTVEPAPIQNIQTDPNPNTRVVIMNGKTYILREGNTYTLTGTEIK